MNTLSPNICIFADKVHSFQEISCALSNLPVDEMVGGWVSQFVTQLQRAEVGRCVPERSRATGIELPDLWNDAHPTAELLSVRFCMAVQRQPHRTNGTISLIEQMGKLRHVVVWGCICIV